MVHQPRTTTIGIWWDATWRTGVKSMCERPTRQEPNTASPFSWILQMLLEMHWCQHHLTTGMRIKGHWPHFRMDQYWFVIFLTTGFAHFCWRIWLLWSVHKVEHQNLPATPLSLLQFNAAVGPTSRNCLFASAVHKCCVLLHCKYCEPTSLYVSMHVCNYVCMYFRTYVHTCIHACIHACMHAYMHAYRHAYMHAYRHAYMHAYMNAYRHAYMHAYRHAYRHAYMHLVTGFCAEAT